MSQKGILHFFFLGLIYLMFFLSGATALIYQVIWVRSLTLIFGGSHLAVTAVLSIFMAGLAIGGYVIGKYVDTVKKLLRLYGLLELGIALFAVTFIGLMKLYPSICLARLISTLFATGLSMTISPRWFRIPGSGISGLQGIISNKEEECFTRRRLLWSCRPTMPPRPWR
jgi:hypothetical protein